MSSHLDRREAFIRAALVIALAGAIAASVEMGTNNTLQGTVPTVMDGLDSVPTYTCRSGLSAEASRALVALVLLLAGAPLAFKALRGIIRQIICQLHYLAAITKGSRAVAAVPLACAADALCRTLCRFSSTSSVPRWPSMA